MYCLLFGKIWQKAVINFPTVRMISYVIVYKGEVYAEHYFDTSELNPLVNKE